MRQRQITDIFTIDINKVVISAKASHNNGKDCHYAVRYQVDGALALTPWIPEVFAIFHKKSF